MKKLDYNDKVDMVIIIIGLVIVLLTVVVEKKITGHYPWMYPRTPIVEILKGD